MSFMRQHQAAATRASGSQQKTNQKNDLHKVAYKKWKGKMMDDRTIVKSFTDFEDRNAKGAELLDNYLDYLRSWIGNDELRHQNDVLIQCVVWAADGQRWDVLFELADAAIALPVNRRIPWFPADSKRELQDFVCDEILKRAMEQEKAGDKVTAPLAPLLERVRDERWPVNHIIKARVRKVLGLQALAAEDWDNAVTLLKEANDLYPKIAVAGKLKEAIKGQQQATSTTPEQSPEDTGLTDSPLEERQSVDD